MTKSEFKLITFVLYFIKLIYTISSIYVFYFYFFKERELLVLLSGFLTFYYAIFFYGLELKFKRGFFEDLNEKIQKSNDLFFKSKRKIRRKQIRRFKQEK